MMKRIAYLALAALIALLAACGGSGSGSSTGGNVSLYVTDNLTQDYTEVWVTIYAVTTTDGNGQTVSLYEDAAGTVQNLRELAGVGSLLNTQNMAEGTYTDFVITLDNQINLVDNNGTTTTATFDTTGNAQFTLTVTGTMTVATGQNTAVALDFDLASFTYDATSNTVAPVVVYQDPTQTQNLTRTFAEMEGYVVSIGDATHFVLSPKHNGENINVVLHDSVVIYKEHAGTTTNDTSALSVNDEVEVYGNFDADTLTIEAVRIKVDDENSSEHTQSAEGSVVSFDGVNLELNISHADFMPGTDTIIVDVSGAMFTRGDSSMLTAGMHVEIEGTWDASLQVFTVVKVEIEGAPRTGDMGGINGNAYADVRGTIDSIDGDLITITVTKAKHTDVMVGSTLIIDTTDAWFKEGSAACLAVGNSLKAKGSVEADAMTARVVKVRCPDNDDSMPEVEGTVVSLTDSTLVVTIARLDDFSGDAVPMIGDDITIDISAACIEHGVSTDLTAGVMVEIKGTWADGVMTATNVEIES